MTGDEGKKPALASAELSDRDFTTEFLALVQTDVIDEMPFTTLTPVEHPDALGIEGLSDLVTELRTASLQEVDLTHLPHEPEKYLYGYSAGGNYWVVKVSRFPRPGGDIDVALWATRAESEHSYSEQNDKGGFQIRGHVSPSGEVSVTEIHADDGKRVNTFTPDYTPEAEE